MTDFRIGATTNTEYDWGSFLFDWCNTPFTTLLMLLENRFQGAFKLENLRIDRRMGNDLQIVVDTFTGQRFPHLFPEVARNALTHESMTQQYPLVLEKMTYLISKTLAVLESNKRILFVRCGPVDSNKVERLLDVLRTVYNLRSFAVLLVPWANDNIGVDTCKENEVLAEQTIWKPVRWMRYPGCIEDWESAFDGVEFAV